MNLYVNRKPPVNSVYYPQDPYLPRKRWRWNPRKAAESLLILAMLVFVAVIMPLAMFVSCTGGR